MVTLIKVILSLLFQYKNYFNVYEWYEMQADLGLGQYI